MAGFRWEVRKEDQMERKLSLIDIVIFTISRLVFDECPRQADED
jgi:hypothetical protein